MVFVSIYCLPQTTGQDFPFLLPLYLPDEVAEYGSKRCAKSVAESLIQLLILTVIHPSPLMFALIPLPEPKERAICGRIFPVAATVTRAVDSTSNLKIIQRRTLHPT